MFSAQCIYPPFLHHLSYLVSEIIADYIFLYIESCLFLFSAAAGIFPSLLLLLVFPTILCALSFTLLKLLTMEKYDVIPMKFNGNNYTAWSFHLKNFVEGQGLFGYLNASITKPTATSSTNTNALSAWSKDSAKVITWILNSIDPSLAIALQAYTIATDMWAHLKNVYHQTNKARKFHLDSEIAKFSQGDKSVHAYFNGFLILWIESDSILIQTVSSGFLSKALKLQEKIHISQFLMNLRPKFESVRSALLNREVFANLDTCFQEVLQEELCLNSQRAIL